MVGTDMECRGHVRIAVSRNSESHSPRRESVMTRESVAALASISHALDHLEEGMPVETVVAAIVDRVAAMRASDLFFASEESGVLVSCRHLGMLRWFRPFSAAYGRRLMNHIKALAGIDPGHRHAPVEGRWLFRRESGETVDLRINGIPTIHGEDLTLRLLDRRHGLIPLQEFGLTTAEYESILGLLRRESGLILVTGPTGSGKSTTLYSCLQHLNDGTRKINTLEDPVEYLVKGLRQSQVNPKFGVDFADLLTACLRQSPDVIMIGEIRDSATAQTAVRAAASGHLVLATLHAPLAVKAVGAMVHLGVSAQSFAETLLGIVSQRLVRKLCPECRRPIDMSPVPRFLADVRDSLPDNWAPAIFEPGACSECDGTGFRSPLCVPEILVVDSEVRSRIAERRSPEEIAEVAYRSRNSIPFRRSALTRVALGATTIEEVMRVIPYESLLDEASVPADLASPSSESLRSGGRVHRLDGPGETLERHGDTRQDPTLTSH